MPVYHASTHARGELMRKEIPYRMPDGTTTWLQPGSRAHQLHTEGKAKDLIAHMKDVQARHEALAGGSSWRP